MIDTLAIENRLQTDETLIVNVLEGLGYTPSDHGDNFRFGNKDGDNPHACILYKNSLVYKNFTRANRDGNIFTLVMHDRRCSFYQALVYVAKKIGYSIADQFNVKLPFGGYFTNIQGRNDKSVKLPIVPDSVYEPYANKWNKKFFEDGVDYLTQKEFNLGYDEFTDSILIPIYSPSGQLCGVKARNNNPDCKEDQRWWAFVRFPKTLIVYGYNTNYLNIVESKTVVVVEAEKSVMQAYSFGFRNCVAILGHKFSKEQIRLIKTFAPEKIIIAFDEGVAESDMLLEALNFQDGQTQVGYIYDKENEILEKGSKNSPTDVGCTKFKKLLKNHVKWLKKEKVEEE